MLAATPGRRFVHRVSRQMGIASRRLDLGVPQQLADRRQVLAERKGPAGEAVPKIVDTNIVEPGLLSDPIPVVGNVGEAAARFAAPR